MKVTIDISGNVVIKLERDEVRNNGVLQPLTKWLTKEIIAEIKETSDRKALEYLNEIGKVTDVPIADRIEEVVLNFKEPEYLETDDSEDHYFDNRQDGMWTCGNCGAPNSVSKDQGCTSCDY